ncbi:MAG: bifunctional 5,10-methylenetetrahydrofolate dehydrogenase/5,10-methenyltetrahydrofolate cyclohydrolase [Culicoidibacterales bacterium]
MILKSKPYIDELYVELEKTVQTLPNQPQLVVVQAGSDAASAVYVKQKLKRAEEIGIAARHLHFPDDVTEQELRHTICQLNDDKAVTGYIIQLPLPSHIDIERLIPYIDPKKDADGFHPQNVGAVTIGNGGIKPCTPKGIIWLLEKAGVNIAGKHAVVVGRSNLVGKPVALLLTEQHATVTLCHSKTINLEHHLQQADIIVAAAGVPQMIKSDMIKKGAVIIDVGIHRKEDGSLCGDVDFDSVIDKVACITPVPGGVGPVTVAMLLQNIVEMEQSRI